MRVFVDGKSIGAIGSGYRRRRKVLKSMSGTCTKETIDLVIIMTAGHGVADSLIHISWQTMRKRRGLSKMIKQPYTTRIPPYIRLRRRRGKNR